MATVRLTSGKNIPLEMHKARIVQKINLIPVEERLHSIVEAGSNTFLLRSKDVYVDMLTDSGVNAMTDNQLSAMMIADDSYAGSETFYRLKDAVCDVFGTTEYIPAHQGRACESIIAMTLVKPGQVVPMNFHFTTTKAHITRMGGEVLELTKKEAFDLETPHDFKGDMDLEQLEATIKKYGREKIAFVRMEAGTNLIGGQPISLENAQAVQKICKKHNILTVYDASLVMDNLYFNKTREAKCKDMSIKEINRALTACFDITYFSGRKFGFAKGGGICTNNVEISKKMLSLVPLFEGFSTYGGMSVREMEAMAVGMRETMDLTVISQGPQFIQYMCDKLKEKGVPVVFAGGLGCHIDAKKFLPHVPAEQYPAGALACALYIAGGIRGMERGTMSEQREADGSERIAAMELLRLAVPRRVYTLSQIEYVLDRVIWLWENREMVGGLKFTDEPEVLRFFFGRLSATSDWQEQLAKKFRADFPDSL